MKWYRSTPPEVYADHTALHWNDLKSFELLRKFYGNLSASSAVLLAPLKRKEGRKERREKIKSINIG